MPMPVDLRTKAEAVSLDMGFSSLQDFIRLFLTKVAKREIAVNIEQFPAVRLSAKSENRYLRQDKDFKAGKNVRKFKNVNDLMSDLSS